MPASIELSNYYYFYQIFSFCCITVLMYYAALITGWTYRSLVGPLAQDRRKIEFTITCMLKFQTVSIVITCK